MTEKEKEEKVAAKARHKLFDTSLRGDVWKLTIPYILIIVHAFEEAKKEFEREI